MFENRYIYLSAENLSSHEAPKAVVEKNPDLTEQSKQLTAMADTRAMQGKEVTEKSDSGEVTHALQVLSGAGHSKEEMAKANEALNALGLKFNPINSRVGGKMVADGGELCVKGSGEVVGILHSANNKKFPNDLDSAIQKLNDPNIKQAIENAKQQNAITEKIKNDVATKIDPLMKAGSRLCQKTARGETLYSTDMPEEKGNYRLILNSQLIYLEEKQSGIKLSISTTFNASQRDAFVKQITAYYISNLSQEKEVHTASLTRAHNKGPDLRQVSANVRDINF